MKSLHKPLIGALLLLAISTTTATAAERTVALVVAGLDCEASQVMVRKSLERIVGVKVRSVDVAASKVHVTVTNDAVADADLVLAAAQAGYQSRTEDDRDRRHE
jgi:cation transport ATPase